VLNSKGSFDNIIINAIKFEKTIVEIKEKFLLLKKLILSVFSKKTIFLIRIILNNIFSKNYII